MKSVYYASVAYAFVRTLGNRSLRPTTLRCIFSIFHNFFFSQFCFALLPGRVPVNRVDHPLDRKIPFTPKWVTIYIDFVPYWIRMLTFLLQTYGSRSLDAVRKFISEMGRLYKFAAKVYRKNLSTTERPFYIAHPKFFMIHFADPHLMCIPSLHVMVVVYTYAKFAAILRSLGDAESRAAQIEEMRNGALAICQAILFVKQHSVNCIGASIYVMTRFDPELFPPEKAEAFCSSLFERLPDSLGAPGTKLPEEDIAEIRAHITDSYRRFQQEGQTSKSWEEPILNFLRQSPKM
ncbi:MAG: hypothetical protein FWB78_03770 [Treponema sp.]|nr:hypothetical protein [Treponema sp.]